MPGLIRFANCRETAKLAEVARKIFAPVSAANEANFRSNCTVHRRTSSPRKIFFVSVAEKLETVSADRIRPSLARRSAAARPSIQEIQAVQEFPGWRPQPAENRRVHNPSRKMRAASAAEPGSRPR